jgi:hypothetical protein
VKKGVGKLGKMGFILGFVSFACMYIYGFLEMGGRTQLTQQDTIFLGSLTMIMGLSVIVILIDRAKTQGREFSWKKFLILLGILILFGIWRITI